MGRKALSGCVWSPRGKLVGLLARLPSHFPRASLGSLASSCFPLHLLVCLSLLVCGPGPCGPSRLPHSCVWCGLPRHHRQFSTESVMLFRTSCSPPDRSALFGFNEAGDVHPPRGGTVGQEGMCTETVLRWLHTLTCHPPFRSNSGTRSFGPS